MAKNKLSVPLNELMRTKPAAQPAVPAEPIEHHQVTRVKKILAAIEALKPTENRDYKLSLNLAENTSGVEVEGLTVLGRVFAESCKLNLRSALLGTAPPVDIPLPAEGDTHGGTTAPESRPVPTAKAGDTGSDSTQHAI
jgi:hypothetical protein